MRYFLKNNLFFTVIFFAFITFLAHGCIPSSPRSVDQKLQKEVTNLADELERGLESENTTRIIRKIHPDYSPSKIELRSQLREVFQRYSVSDFEFHSLRFNRADGEVNLEISWNLRWRNTVDDKVELYSGRTTFRLRRVDEEQFQIVSQRGDRLLGNKFSDWKPINE